MGDGTQRINGGQKEQHDLEHQLDVPHDAGMIRTLPVKPEQDGHEKVDDGNGRDDRKANAPREGKKAAEEVLLGKIRHHVLRPQQHADRHGEIIDHGVYEKEGGEVEAVKEPPKDVGDIIGHDAIQEVPVYHDFRKILVLPTVKKNVVILYDKHRDGE